ncbi:MULTISPECIES: hypothetical protein [unclassified Crossiella]|uniref:hypothetical protein n=1 Tax=unclassified Crossiella TaxID=2620835 RepID=UPI001FFF9FD4|nr:MULTISPECIES: hypothetical protein [unclassified Crossiella]MCK2244616.1 hypothetical protein [Crossiella sp. S99.2]MCK2258397.1 hypothetical protein [Crossiella sp. S99.1]
MKIRSIRTRLAAVAAAVAILPAAAQLAHAGEPGAVAAAPDGRVLIWSGYHYTDYCNAWASSPDTLGPCHDTTSSVCNRGWVGDFDDVWLFQHTHYQGAKRGLYNARCIDDLRNFKFDASNISMDNQISSMKWTNLA